jgi:hypothetical protein
MIQVNLLLPIAGKKPDSFAVLDLMRLPFGIYPAWVLPARTVPSPLLGRLRLEFRTPCLQPSLPVPIIAVSVQYGVYDYRILPSVEKKIR